MTRQQRRAAERQKPSTTETFRIHLPGLRPDERLVGDLTFLGGRSAQFDQERQLRYVTLPKPYAHVRIYSRPAGDALDELGAAELIEALAYFGVTIHKGAQHGS
jgi:hypothetical protein